MRYRTIGTGSAARRVSAICLGALPFGSTVDEETSFAILDRFVAAGGSFVDTANNYAFWVPGFQGGESETVLGRWRADRGVGDEVTIATKLGALPRTPGGGLEDAEGLSADAVRSAAERSRERLGMERLDVLYTHIEDRSVPLEETLGALADEVAGGRVGLLGASNHAVWRLERARALSAARGRPGYEVLQYRYSYLQPRVDVPFPEKGHVHAGPELLDYVRSENAAGGGPALVVYTALLAGAYSNPAKTLSEPYDHPGTGRRLAALRDVAKEADATPNQVVLSWLLDGDPPVIPLVGVSSTAQLDEVLASVDLTLTPDQRHRLDEAR
ncbi:aldo/keto reductase [Marinitenerispora sediminis]|uniref:Oxidoreductase n=1 Tax=Marinitenerispora sediminis TaxID=1931232 RepID=A0A368SZA5_9ACTN|nr:aldo/keto reductase [Marinitenerispora sediminis]RCV47698.1 oxidoreductase [Marinitenerispora sediminis]RCV48159.1 oxidoreductase [Marinitenerispora sediminis]RCV50511.1 oxidoreductase [Marinitenerispora sediminis]